jgi:hypothetical protein
MVVNDYVKGKEMDKKHGIMLGRSTIHMLPLDKSRKAA